MARPEKTGLDYFNVDTNIFQNRKIRRLISSYGSSGFTIYLFVLTEIYRDKGHFLAWDSDSAFDVADSLKVKENLVKDVINFCCSVKLFNKELLSSENVITNLKVQEFWTRVVKSAGRKQTRINPAINLINSVETTLNTPKPELSTPKPQLSTQSKVKESKVKENIVEREGNFKKEIFTHTNFPESILKNFFNYWAEKDTSGLKMRFEEQKFFNLKNRLEKWQENEKQWANDKKSSFKSKSKQGQSKQGQNLEPSNDLKEKFSNYDN